MLEFWQDKNFRRFLDSDKSKGINIVFNPNRDFYIPDFPVPESTLTKPYFPSSSPRSDNLSTILNNLRFQSGAITNTPPSMANYNMPQQWGNTWPNKFGPNQVPIAYQGSQQGSYWNSRSQGWPWLWGRGNG